MGPYQAAFKTKEMIDLGITHVLNVTCKAYTPRKKFFKYLNIDIHDDSKEDAKKHFRATNRFINECLAEGGKLLVQSVEGKSRAPTFILAYMINRDRFKLRDCLLGLRQFVGEVEPNEGFMAQLAQYDLELL
jgi:protein-tyrosine phosphatase